MIRIDNILCPVDFFPAADRAVEYAIALARNYKARLTLLHVVSLPPPPAYDAPWIDQTVVDSIVSGAGDALNKSAQRAKDAGVQADSLVAIGNTDSEIRKVAAETHSDLVVMGTHGRRAFEKWFLGSTTERLIRQLHLPLLTVSAAASKPTATGAPVHAIRNILITTDFSAGTPDAIRYGFSIAQENQASVTLLHVVSDVAADVSGVYREALIQGIRSQLQALAPAEAQNWCRINVRVETGLSFRIILKVLEEESFDLVVMNIHGKNRFESAVIGSTAERVVRGASSPVLLIPSATP